MRLAEIAGKRVAILGYGREGVAAAALLRHRFPELPLTVFSEAPAQVPDGLVLRQGPFDAAELSQFDVLLKSPGISLYRPELQQAQQAGAVLTSGSALWFAEPRQAMVIAITGSKGKSTTAALIHFLLRAAGRDAVLAGNIGVPLLQLFEPLGKPEFYVVELSSFQVADFAGRPDIALLTNLFPEHLDWHGSKENYYQDKLKLFANTPSLSLINAADAESMRASSGLTRTLFNDLQGWHLSADQIVNTEQLVAARPAWGLPGAHNLSNLIAALAAVDGAGVDVRPGIERLAEFRGLPHRLQRIGEINAIELVDDSISTAPQATIAALQAYSGRAATVIVGGHDRGVDWQVFVDFLAASPANLVIARGDNGAMIAELVRAQLPDQPVCELAGMHQAVDIGLKMTPAGGLLLLSPGAPSFGEFDDFKQRGRAFARAAGLAAG